MILYTDGGCNKDGAYGSWRLELDNGDYVACMDREPYPEITTNNGAEYVSILRGLAYCISRHDEHDDFKTIILHTDSKLVVEQVKGNWKCNHEHLQILREKVRMLMTNFDTMTFERVGRDIIVSKLGH